MAPSFDERRRKIFGEHTPRSLSSSVRSYIVATIVVGARGTRLPTFAAFVRGPLVDCARREDDAAAAGVAFVVVAAAVVRGWDSDSARTLGCYGA